MRIIPPLKCGAFGLLKVNKIQKKMVENQSSVSEESSTHKAEPLLKLITEANGSSSVKSSAPVNFFLENNLYIIEKLENSKIKLAQEKQENTVPNKLEQELTQKINEQEEIPETNQDDSKAMTAAQEAFSSTMRAAPLSYERPEQDEDLIDYEINRINSTVGTELQYSEEAETEEKHAELLPIKMEVVQTMIKNSIAVENPNFDFLNSYVSPEDRERYEMFRMLNPTFIRNLELSMLQYSGEPKF